MPEAHISSLAVIRKKCLTNCYGEEVSQLLTGEVIPRLPLSTIEVLYRPYNRYLSIVTQSGWFHSKVRELQELSGIGGLAYLHEESCTHEHKAITKDQAGRVVWVQTEGYTVLTSGWDAEIATIQGLEDWCRKHPEEAGNVLENNGRYVLEAIESQFFTLDPGNEGLGEGNGPEFFFSTLRTISELMRFARFHKNTPDMWVIYHTTLRYGS
jgi:hypothetical protein